jgi:hypothetical protein
MGYGNGLKVQELYLSSKRRKRRRDPAAVVEDVALVGPPDKV